jgi:hypothetical protein
MSGKIALSISSKGVDTVVFMQDKRAAADFYNLIQDEIQAFENRILQRVQERKSLLRGIANDKKN